MPPAVTPTQAATPLAKPLPAAPVAAPSPPARVMAKDELALRQAPAPKPAEVPLAARQRAHIHRSLLVAMLGGTMAMLACASLMAGGVLPWAMGSLLFNGGLVGLVGGGLVAVFGMPKR